MDPKAHDLISGEVQEKLAKQLMDQLSKYNLTDREKEQVSLAALKELTAVFIAGLSERLQKQALRNLSFRASSIRKAYKETVNG